MYKINNGSNYNSNIIKSVLFSFQYLNCIVPCVECSSLTRIYTSIYLRLIHVIWGQKADSGPDGVYQCP